MSDEWVRATISVDPKEKKIIAYQHRAPLLSIATILMMGTTQNKIVINRAMTWHKFIYLQTFIRLWRLTALFENVILVHIPKS